MCPALVIIAAGRLQMGGVNIDISSVEFLEAMLDVIRLQGSAKKITSMTFRRNVLWTPTVGVGNER